MLDALIFFTNNVLISGLVVGSIYAMGAIGVTLIFSILRFAHFAHGELMTTGAFVVLLLTMAFPGVGPAIGLPTAFVMLPIGMVITSALAVVADYWFYAPLRKANTKPVVMVMASVGVTLMLQALVRVIGGTSSRSMYVNDTKSVFRLDLPFESATQQLIFTEAQLLLLGFVTIAVIALHFFLTRTRLGKAMRAMSDNPDLARVSGIDTRIVVRVTWIIAGSLATAAGVLLSLDVTFKPDLSFHILLPIFAAAIVGGVGHPYGAIIGGFVVGFSETLAVFNWAVLLRPFESILPEAYELPNKLSFVPTEYKITVPFFILIVILLWRPTGILKGKVL